MSDQDLSYQFMRFPNASRLLVVYGIFDATPYGLWDPVVSAAEHVHEEILDRIDRVRSGVSVPIP
jgi:hypothetical protein